MDKYNHIQRFMLDDITHPCLNFNSYYRIASNMSRTLVGNKIIDHSDVFEAAPVQLHLHSRLITWFQWIGQGQGKDETRNI